MIHHIVLFKWNDDASAEAVDEAAEALKALHGVVPGLLEVRFGPALGASTDFDHAAVFVVETEELFAQYLSHPAHVDAARRYLHPIRESIRAFDFSD